jgi:hypothetical protein
MKMEDGVHELHGLHEGSERQMTWRRTSAVAGVAVRFLLCPYCFVQFVEFGDN